MATLVFLFSGDDFQGPPVANIVIDGVALPDTIITVLHGSGSQAISTPIAPGLHAISVNMVQDAYGGSPATDRNLYLESVTLDGVDQKISANLMTATPFAFNLTVPSDTVDLTPVLDAIAAVQVDGNAKSTAILTAIEALQADVDAKFAALAAAPASAASSSSTSAGTTAPALNTTFPAGWTAITLSPTDSLNAAFAVAAKGFVATLAAGTYNQVAAVPPGLDGWMIKGATGNPADVVVNGGGGLTVAANSVAVPGTPGRLSQGKGVFHLASCGTFSGLEVTGGGLNATDGHDGQAGIYWECSNGTATVHNSIVQGNQNGIFGNSSNANINYVCDTVQFFNNGTDGGSHDTYLEGTGTSSATFKNCQSPGSNAGNDLKSRVATVSIDGCWLGTKNSNRWYDCADGATLSVTNSTLVGNDTGENVAANGDETTNLAAGNTTWSNNTVFVGNRQQDLCNAGTFIATGTTVYFTGPNSSLTNSKGTPLTGLPLTNPVPGQYVPYPAEPAFVPAAA